MTISDNFVYPASEVSEIDKLAMQLATIPGLALMREAADFAYDKAIEFYPDTSSIVVFFISHDLKRIAYRVDSSVIQRQQHVTGFNASFLRWCIWSYRTDYEFSFPGDEFGRISDDMNRDAYAKIRPVCNSIWFVNQLGTAGECSQ